MVARACLAATLVFTSLGVAATSASARSPQALVDEARAHYEEGRYGRAAELLEEAHALEPDPKLLWNMARALELAGELKQAKQRLTELIASRRATRRQTAKAAEMLVRVGGRLKRRAKARTLAELEEVLGEELVQARRDANQELVAKLDSELAAARARDAEARAPEEPPEPEPPAPEPAAEPVEPVVEPSPPEPTPTLDVTEVSSAVEPSGGSAVAGWATLGAGSALAIAGVVVVVVGESRFERIQAGVSPDGTLQKLSGAEESRLRSEGRLMRGLGWTGVAVGLGAAATGLLVALMVDDDEIDARPSAEVGAALTPRGGGVLVRGAF